MRVKRIKAESRILFWANLAATFFTSISVYTIVFWDNGPTKLATAIGFCLSCLIAISATIAATHLSSAQQAKPLILRFVVAVVLSCLTAYVTILIFWMAFFSMPDELFFLLFNRDEFGTNH